MAVFVFALPLLLSGCGEAIQNSGEDNAFIREPGADKAENSSALPAVRSASSLLPARPGSVWRNRLTLPENDKQDQPIPKLYDKAICRSAVVSGAGTSIMIDVQPEKPNNNVRTERYQVTQKGVFLSGSTGDQEYAVTPPLPLILLPIREDQIYKWSGSLRMSKKSYPAQGYSRVSRLETMDAKGKAKAWRIDTAITANAGGRPVGIIMSRWFQPGVGIVRQRYFAGNLKIWKEMVSYKL